MRTLNNEINLDHANSAGKNVSKEAMQIASEITESPATAKESRWTRKRIGLIGLTFLLVIGILLIPTKVTQNEAKATPLQLILSATYFVVLTAVRWGINETLSETKRKLLEHHGGITLDDDAEGTAEVNAAWWTGNSTTEIRKRKTWYPASQSWSRNWTTTGRKTASQGHQWDTSPVGTRIDGTAMRTAEAERFLSPARYTVKNSMLELFGRNPDGTVYYKQDAAVFGREDAYARNKARELRIWRGIYGNHLFFGPETYIRTLERKVDDYEMKSIWDSDGWSALGHADAEDPEANTYEGKLYWKFRNFLSSGRLGIVGHGRNSLTSNPTQIQKQTIWFAKKKNQVITQGPDISNSISRKFKTEPTYTNMWVQFHDGNGGITGARTRSYWKWVRIHNGYKRLVVHFEKGAR